MMRDSLYAQGQNVLLDALREDLDLVAQIVELAKTRDGGTIDFKGIRVIVEPMLE